MGPLPPSAQPQAKGASRRGLPPNTWSTAEARPGFGPHLFLCLHLVKSSVGAADKETTGGGPGSPLPSCTHSFTCQGTRVGPQRAGRSQLLSYLPVPLAGGWACGHPLPRADMSPERGPRDNVAHFLAREGLLVWALRGWPSLPLPRGWGCSRGSLIHPPFLLLILRHLVGQDWLSWSPRGLPGEASPLPPSWQPLLKTA